ncbi:MAG: methyltransferase domain-containing protein, partial [Pseudomonadota bacterium]
KYPQLALGCGTGLAGALLKDRAGYLAGIDLSPGMLEEARARGDYDHLEEADLDATLKTTDPGSWDLVISVDTLVYIGDLAATFPGMARALAPGGCAIITVEAAKDGSSTGFTLTPSGRYAHTRHYLEEQAASSGLTVVEIREDTIRRELAEDVRGYVATFARR